MHAFLRTVSVEINIRAKTINHVWGGRYRWSLIDSQRHYYQVYRYIYQNPIRAGLVRRVEDYQFSTLNKELPFPLHSNIAMSFGGEEGELIWLNEKYESEDIDLIKSGLRKSQFDLNKRKLKAFEKLTLPNGPKGT
jgi:putative transposase